MDLLGNILLIGVALIIIIWFFNLESEPQKGR
jgi:hypothetical protein